MPVDNDFWKVFVKNLILTQETVKLNFVTVLWSKTKSSLSVLIFFSFFHSLYVYNMYLFFVLYILTENLNFVYNLISPNLEG